MIHQFQMGSLNIVLDINSGSIHIVDDITKSIIDAYDGQMPVVPADLPTGYLQSDYEDALKEVTALIAQGQLFSEDFEIPQHNGTRKDSVVKALCLHIAHDCNLTCRYCFAGEGQYHGHRSMMSAKTGKMAIDFLIAHSGTRRNLEVDFFGGEPTLNMDAVKEIVAYAKEQEKQFGKNFRFTLTTNGVLLDEDIINFANAHMHNVVLSIDGRKEVNDKIRVNAAGAGCYDTIVPKFLKFAKSRNGQNYYVRGTYTKENLDFANDVFHLASLGFDQISVEPVVAPPQADYALQEEDIELICAQYDKIAEEIVLRETNENKFKWFNFFHFNIDLNNGACAIKRITGCGAGCEYLSVTPEGDLYPCHQFAGMADFKIGNITRPTLNHTIVQQFDGVNVYTKPACRGCWAKYYCSGGCAANAFAYGGDIHSVYEIGCALQKKRIECAIYIQASQFIAQHSDKAVGGNT